MPKRYASFLIATAGLFLVLSPVSAQDSATSTTEAPTPAVTRPNAKQKAPAREAAKTMRQNLKEKRQEERMLLKEKLAEMKDVRKQAAVTRIDTKLTAINTRRTTHMEGILSRLQKILDVVEQKAIAAKETDADTEIVDQAVITADAAILAAQDAVAMQKEQDYVMTITSEATVRQSATAIITSLRTDLTNTRASVVAAKEAVLEAALALQEIQKPATDDDMTPTVTEEPEE